MRNEIDPRAARFFAEHNPHTPCLVLDLVVVAQRYREIFAAMPFAIPYYAVKAGPEIRVLAAQGACFDVASPAEIDLCQAEGIAPESLSYGKYALPLTIDIGDTVDSLSAGAYTASYSSSGFNGFPPLPTYCIEG